MVLLPSQAQTEEQVVQSIKDDIQAVKAKTRETRNLLREQERDLRKLTTELERTRVTIQQNKQRERNAKKSGKSFTPKPVERTYISRFAHDKAEAKPATPERKTVHIIPYSRLPPQGGIFVFFGKSARIRNAHAAFDAICGILV